MPTFDYRCDRCSHSWEDNQKYDAEAPECPECGSNFTKKVFLKMNTVSPYDAYDALDRVIPDAKKIKSFANDRRKGGKDTT